MAYEAMILLPPETDVTIEKVRQLLEDYYGNDPGEVDFETRGENKLIVTIDDWNSYISLNSDPDVLEESGEMAEMFAQRRADKEEIAVSAKRLEIRTEDDDDMEFFNDYVRIIEQLGKLRGAKIWEGGQQAFMD